MTYLNFKTFQQMLFNLIFFIIIIIINRLKSDKSTLSTHAFTEVRNIYYKNRFIHLSIQLDESHTKFWTSPHPLLLHVSLYIIYSKTFINPVARIWVFIDSIVNSVDNQKSHSWFINLSTEYRFSFLMNLMSANWIQWFCLTIVLLLRFS